MKITGRNYNLKPGTILEALEGTIAIDSEYDTNYKRYEYHDMDCNDDGELIDLPTGGYITPVDLIGYEIVSEPKPVIKSFEYKEVNESDVQALEQAGVEFDCVVDNRAKNDHIINDQKQRLGRVLRQEVEYKEVNEADIQVLKNAGVDFDCVKDSSGKYDYIIRYEKAISQQVQEIISNSLNSSLKRWYN